MNLTFDDDNIMIYQNGNPKIDIVLFSNEDEELIKLIDFECRIITFKEIDLESYFTPWPFGHFKGLGNETIDKIFKYVENDCLVIGYSLGGLMAIISGYRVNNVKAIGSISGSLWYPNLLEHLKENKIRNKNIYLSLGDLEGKCKNKLMCQVDEKTKEVVNLLSKDNKVYFEYNKGNHFTDCPQRIVKGLRYLLDIEGLL